MSNSEAYNQRVKALFEKYHTFNTQPNEVDPDWDNGWFKRYKRPIITSKNVPPHWRYDLNEATNPRLMERLGINVAFNAGAIELDGKIYIMVRTEGYDRKSFFALAETTSGLDNVRFVDKPIVIPQLERPDTNVYDMRLVKHEDGCIYGVFCSERKDPNAPEGDTSMAEAQCGIIRSKDLIHWERLADIKTPSPQQRNVVLHPEFVDGKYAFYTRPQDGFISTGSGGGIGYGLSESIENAVLTEEKIIDEKVYHTVKESKNGMGLVPFKTEKGWLHIAHGVRECATGLRYLLYAFLCDLDDPSKVIARPGGYFLAPWSVDERLGDLSNIIFANGGVMKDNGDIFIYYASGDTQLHVATTDVDTLLDYVLNTPEDPYFSHLCVEQRRELIEGNQAVMDELGLDKYV